MIRAFSSRLPPAPHGCLSRRTGIVALAEIGDKTQLLAFLLAARFRRPLPIVFGILVATLPTTPSPPPSARWWRAAGAFGDALGAGPVLPRHGGWTMIPDKIDETEAALAKFGVFMTTLIAFFLAEMGDKTQVATVALAARYTEMAAVVAGTTLGMMLANVPAVYFGERIANKVPLGLVHGIAALIFAGLGRRDACWATPGAARIGGRRFVRRDLEPELERGAGRPIGDRHALVHAVGVRRAVAVQPGLPAAPCAAWVASLVITPLTSRSTMRARFEAAVEHSCWSKSRC
jgi:putative Ca2+/H+ antiporter (TMEM165/GDT1 family)